MSPNTEMLDTLTESANAIAMLTGIRAQLINAGWSEHNAELIVLEMLRASNNACPTPR